MHTYLHKIHSNQYDSCVSCSCEHDLLISNFNFLGEIKDVKFSILLSNGPQSFSSMVSNEVI